MNKTNSPEKADKEILELTLRDKRFFSLFYQKYFRKIYSYCLNKNNYNRDITEDIVSNIFMKALEKIETVKLDEEHEYSLLPWLYTISRNTVLNSWASQKKESNTVQYNDDIEHDDNTDTYSGSFGGNLGSGDGSDGEVLSMNPNLDKQIDFEQDSAKLRKAIMQLDEIAKDIVWKRTFDELQFNEIAELLGMKEAAVKMRYYRAIEIVTNLVKNG